MNRFDTDQNDRNGADISPEEPQGNAANETIEETPAASADRFSDAPQVNEESEQPKAVTPEQEFSGSATDECASSADGTTSEDETSSANGTAPDDETPPEEETASGDETSSEDKTPAEDCSPTEKGTANTGKGKKANEPPALFLFDLAELVAVSLAVVMLLLTFFMRQSPVNGNSMYPTIKGTPDEGAPVTKYSGNDILLISNLFYSPEPGDIVVIQTPTVYSNTENSMNHPIVKRVIAVGGDQMTIDFDNWRIELVHNGENIVFEEGYGKASYVNYEGGKHPMNGLGNIKELQDAITEVKGNTYTLQIPEGKVFVMGDNRDSSHDSRRIGLIDERWIAGKALIRIYPFDRFGSIE